MLVPHLHCVTVCRGQVPQEQLQQVMAQQFEENLQQQQDALLRKWDCTEEVSSGAACAVCHV
jgi:predicted nucleic acid-binding Zn ribbon protein